jgi:inhibitor of cysteine peptidase
MRAHLDHNRITSRSIEKGRSKTRIKLCVLGILLILSTLYLSACGSSDEVKLGARDDGSQVDVEKGQTLVITLDSSPSTGNRWEMVASEDGVLQQVGEAEFRPVPWARYMVGAGGKEILRFKAEKAGQTDLELVYHQPWEKGVKPSGTFAVQAVVRY